MRTIVITGASDGIGTAAARQLAQLTAPGGSGRELRLILVGHSPEKTRAVAEPLGAEFLTVDFAHLDEVQSLANRLSALTDHIDVLANNAGGIFSGPVRTGDGYERTYQINVLAPALLTNLLLPQLEAANAAVVNTASVAARIYSRFDPDDLQTVHGFTPNRAYGNAKLGNILFTKGLHRHMHSRGISTVAFHPGIVATNFASQTTSYLRWAYHGLIGRLFFTSPQQGGARLVRFIQGRPGADWISGEYYEGHSHPARTARVASLPGAVEHYWDQLNGMLGLRW